MHYRNGREARNGDKIVQLCGYDDSARIVAFGVLYNAHADRGDVCNGAIAPVQNAVSCACLRDCLHIDDVAELLKAKGFHKRPKGKRR